jgi:hypothetical protein
MKVEDLPQPLQDWLLELEGFHLRIERLYDELQSDPPARVLDWLAVAYDLGREQGQPPKRQAQADAYAETQDASTWESYPTGQSELVIDETGISLRVGEVQFAANREHNAVGLICFAYGLDSELFAGVRPDSDTHRWLIWHFAALLSKQGEDPDLPVTLRRALGVARELAPDDAVRAEVQRRVEALLGTIGEHHGVELQALRVAREFKAGLGQGGGSQGK